MKTERKKFDSFCSFLKASMTNFFFQTKDYTDSLSETLFPAKSTYKHYSKKVPAQVLQTSGCLALTSEGSGVPLSTENTYFCYLKSELFC